MARLAILLLIIIEVTVIASALIALPERIFSVGFWLTIAWFAFLIFLNWFISSYILFRLSDVLNRPVFGALPSLNIVVFLYSLVSAGLLSTTWFAPGFDAASKVHLISQVVAFGFSAVIVVFIYIAAKSAEMPSADGTITTRELAQKIELLIQDAPNDELQAKNQLKELLEQVRYSLPHSSKLVASENYKELCVKVMGMDSDTLSNSELRPDFRELMKLARNS